ncbi:UDP-N-acetylmuramoylalanyl-D-glutamate--2,6-diaminopimelate ligase [Gordonibacter sp. An230]|uniref:UDP-N-acetylmuramoylalanyl-D-glutamate--2, 6-diaminopimelate ligase n=1 Tax=Gordonibacter sp. An230 TaxID=1965592 RepID=UPI000B36CF26|nr:UDP-N-acetylmuramoylalanyl-D-glutamate--2,6-diaminopimelate ligase [Gordonibacter sp. An230]OUO87005.1 UDP-N-acetylmuramoylalanyl-D-glutamate--2,6-diaminopimelate ligase [Gordonibacter sp. An230]
MSKGVSCPACGIEGLDVCRYEAMMVVRADLALFTLRCPRCGAVVSSMQRIPSELREEVRFAALEVGAGMGRE